MRSAGLICAAILIFIVDTTFAGGPCSGVRGGCGRSTYRSSSRYHAPSYPSATDSSSWNDGFCKTVNVRSYTRSDGTHVRGHTRRSAGCSGTSIASSSDSYNEDTPTIRAPRTTSRAQVRTSYWNGTSSSYGDEKEGAVVATTAPPSTSSVAIKPKVVLPEFRYGQSASTSVGAESIDKPVIEHLEGVVVGIMDADVIVISSEDKQQRRIRFDEIDAPDQGQPFHDKASGALASLVLGKMVQVDVVGVDRLSRLAGRVWLDGESVNVRMVRDGWAWHYRKFSNSTTLAQAQEEAKANRRGLWAGKEPVEPWVWRGDTPAP